MTTTETLTETTYREAVEALRALGAALSTAREIRFEPSPLLVPEGSRGIPNPTLDTVLDPRRMAVHDEFKIAAVPLREATVALTRQTSALNASIARWQGEPSPTE